MDPKIDRYTDAHVRGDDTLRRAAQDYVLSYSGDFVLIKYCRDRLNDGWALTTPQVRAILNAMRADPAVRNLPVPVLDDYEERRWGSGLGESAVRYRKKLVQRPAYIDLPTKLHYDYVMSLHKTAVVVHRVSHNGSFIRYYPHMTQKRFHDRFRLHLRLVCSTNLPRRSSSHPGVQMLTTHEVEVLVANGLRRLCPTCNQH